MAFHVQIYDLLARQAVMSVPVDREHLGELVAALLEVRALLRIDVTEIGGPVQPRPPHEWPEALRQIVADAHLKLPGPVAIPADDPHGAARRIARLIAGAEIVESDAGYAVQRPGRRAADVLFHRNAPQPCGALN